MVLLRLPPRVKLVSVDVAIQLEQLAFLIQHGEPGATAPEFVLEARKESGG